MTLCWALAARMGSMWERTKGWYSAKYREGSAWCDGGEEEAEEGKGGEGKEEGKEAHRSG